MPFGRRTHGSIRQFAGKQPELLPDLSLRGSPVMTVLLWHVHGGRQERSFSDVIEMGGITRNRLPTGFRRRTYHRPMLSP